MKATCRLSFVFPRERLTDVRAFLDAMGLADGVEPPPTPMGLPSFQQTLNADDPRLEKLMEFIREQGLECFRRLDHRYSVTELKQFPFLRLTVNRRSIDGGGPSDGTDYDLTSACPACGTGAVQTSPVLLRRAEVPGKGDLVQTHVWHLLISERLAEVFRERAVSGIELRQALLRRTRAPLPWWQILCSHTMPRAGPRTLGLLHDISPGWGCTVCNRDMYAESTEQPLVLVYDRAEVDPASLPDVVQTWECFGRSILRDDPVRHVVQGYAQPMILINQKVFAILRELKVRHAFYTPVKIE